MKKAAGGSRGKGRRPDGRRGKVLDFDEIIRRRDAEAEEAERAAGERREREVYVFPPEPNFPTEELEALRAEAEQTGVLHPKRGRPRKLTPRLMERICAIIRDGNLAVTAFQLAGISESTFYRWLQWGSEHAAAGRKTDFAEFWRAVKAAEAQREVRLVGLVNRIAPGDWRAAVRMLAASNRAWSETTKVVGPGPGGALVTAGVQANVGGADNPRDLAEVLGTVAAVLGGLAPQGPGGDGAAPPAQVDEVDTHPPDS